MVVKGVTKPARLGDERPRIPVAPDEEWILSGLALGKHVLEIGTGYGVSTRAMAITARSVTTVDDLPVEIDPAPEGSAPITRFLSVAEIPEAALFQMAFIDGCHDDTAVCKDIIDCLPRLRPHSLIVFHDANYGNILQGCRLAGIEPFVIPTTYGLGIWRKP